MCVLTKEVALLGLWTLSRSRAAWGLFPTSLMGRQMLEVRLSRSDTVDLDKHILILGKHRVRIVLTQR